MLRRTLLSTSALLPPVVFLAACGITQPSSPGTIPAQVITDVNGVLIQLDNILPALSTTIPPVIPPALEATLIADVNYAFKALSTVSSSTSAMDGATVLARIEGYGGAVLGALLAVPLPPPYNLAVIAANIVWSSLESYINSLIPPPAGAPAPSPAMMRAKGHPSMSLAEARAQLKIPTAQ